MKKLVTLFLILALAVPAAAMAADRDPIVGCWYILIDSQENPEMSSYISGVDKAISIYDFLDNGIIMMLDLSVKDGQGTPTYYSAGRWSKEGDTYNYSIIGFGEGDAFIKDRDLFISIQTDSAVSVYMKSRRIEYFNPYADYVRK